MKGARLGSIETRCILTSSDLEMCFYSLTKHGVFGSTNYKHDAI